MLLLHACGGVASGFGLLLLVPVGGLAFLLPARSALFLAAVAALAVLCIRSGSSSPDPPISRRTPPPAFWGRVVHDRGLGERRREPHARERESRSPEGPRSRESRRAVAVHRAASAREPFGGRCRGQDSSDQRIRGRDSRRRPCRARRVGRRGLPAFALFLEHLAARRAGRGRALEFRGRRRRAADPTALRPSRLRARAPP